LIYEFTLTVPADTKKESPVTKRLKLTAGVITRMSWFWPIGTHQLGHLQVYEGKYQLWPSNPDGDLTGDGESYTFDEYHVLKKPYVLMMKAWNDDDTYEHTVTLRFNIIRKPPEPYLRRLSHEARMLHKLWRQYLTGEE